MRILVIEDEIQLARKVVSSLEQAGHEVRTTNRGETALNLLYDSAFDLLVIDVRLPGVDGFEVLRQLRSLQMTSRVLMLTAAGEVQDKVNALGLGADDYVTKPFAMQELLARVEALGRRYPQEPTVKLKVADLVLDLSAQQVHRAGRRIELSARELALLRILLREPGRVFTRTELCERIWHRQHDYDTKLVEVFVGRLRKKIDGTSEVSLIKTVRHLGYSIVQPP
jgi:DNA-binding response OmpR family regulator